MGPILTAPCCRECCGFFFFWPKSYNSAVFSWKSILFWANFDGTQLPWVPWIFWLKLLASQVGQFSRHLAAVSVVVFFRWLNSYNCAVLPWKSILFSNSFHSLQLPWMPWIFFLKLLTSWLDQFPWHLAAVSVVVFLLIKVVCRITLKSILFSANFHPTQLSWGPWIFWLKLLISQVSKFLRLLSAVSAVVFFCWLKFYNCAVMSWKSILFSDCFHGTQLLWVPWVFCL